MLECFLVFLGGGIGSSLRYLTSILFEKNFGLTYPFGTFAVNILGCLFLGFILAFLINKPGGLHTNAKLFLATGIAGGFTTFSTFGYETIVLIRNGQLWEGFSYVLSSLILGLLFICVGMYIAKFV